VQTFDIVVRSPISESVRCRQLESMFDVPFEKESRVEWHVEMLNDEFDWTIGLIYGPSGSGKSILAKRMYGKRVDRIFRWPGKSVVDDFPKDRSMKEISQVCQAVGFGTIPAWLRPFRVLSNGEKFRVTLARLFVESDELIVVDEFTSVVDRQVAKIGSHAVQKFIRRANPPRKFVAISCHDDIIPWLRPDWILHTADSRFERRRLRQGTKRQVTLDIEIKPVPHKTWQTFCRFHYLTKELHRAARCFALFVNGTIAAFAGMLYRPQNQLGRRKIMGCSRLVTLPDYQGLGLAFVLIDRIAGWYKACGRFTHTYPAHPALIKAFDRSTVWSMKKTPGEFSTRSGQNSKMGYSEKHGRPCGVFRFVGPPGDAAEARRVFSYWPGHIKPEEYAKLVSSK